MGWYDHDEDREDVALEIARRREKGEPFKPVACDVARGFPAITFWGRAWCEHLAAFGDYESRLPLGRTYLRKGQVYDIEISSGYVFAYVAGRALYEIEISMVPLDAPRWRSLKQSVSGRVRNLVDLLGGNLGEGVMAAVTDREDGIFPSPDEIQINCNCPDYAGLCKHGAAVLYGIGILFDSAPELLFTLRGVDADELIGSATSSAAALVAHSGGEAPVFRPDELSEIFGIELADPESAFTIDANR